MQQNKFDAESAAIKKRFLEKLDGGGWAEFQRDGDDVIFSRSFDDAPTPAFLARYTLAGQGANGAAILRMMHEYDERFKWDSESLDKDSHKIEQITPTRSVDCSVSLPALGGVISSREFCDLREFDLAPGFEGFLYWSGSVEKQMKFAATKGRVLGGNFPCGLRAKRDGADLKMEMLWHSEVRGWLPTSVVAKAMPGTMASTIRNLRAYLAKHH